MTIIDSNGYEILNSEKGTSIDDINFERIVACVNACAGISTEKLCNLPVSLEDALDFWTSEHNHSY